MILCLDSGNSRIKYGFCAADGDWLACGALAHDQCGELTRLLGEWPTPTRILLANVAGAAAEARIRAALGDCAGRLEVVRSTPAAAGVVNGYRQPERLGVDRWCALIGARQLQAGALLVVMAGTATTIDALDADGRFLGGLILPGQQLMLAALARATAGLPFAAGRHAAWPQSTDDAIVSGALEAQAGAVERAWARLPGAVRSCLVSGGNAEALIEHLVIPAVRADNLPLHGLRQLARETA